MNYIAKRSAPSAFLTWKENVMKSHFTGKNIFLQLKTLIYHSLVTYQVLCVYQNDKVERNKTTSTSDLFQPNTIE